MDGRNNMKKVAMVGFPEDVEKEILLRLPVKSLLKFKTVCKSWNSTISSTIFIREHLKVAHAARYNQHKNFLGILDALLFKEDSDGVMLAKKFDFPAKNIGPEKDISPWARNSCDGLICYRRKYPNTLVLWNPSLPAEYKVIDTKRFPFVSNCGMGYDPCTDDYKIVGVSDNSVCGLPCAYNSVQLLSLKSNSWRIVIMTKTMDFRIVQRKVIYTKNRLHWLGRSYRHKEYEFDDDDDDDDDESEDEAYLIVYFDLVKESLKFLNLPSSSDRLVVPLNYKESLGISCRNPDGEEEIWVLQDYCGMESSWSKLFKFSCSDSWPYDYCFTLKGELLKCNRNGLAIVDPIDGSLKDVVCEGDYDKEENYGCIFTSPYVESLVSPRKVAENITYVSKYSSDKST